MVKNDFVLNTIDEIEEAKNVIRGGEYDSLKLENIKEKAILSREEFVKNKDMFEDIIKAYGLLIEVVDELQSKSENY